MFCTFFNFSFLKKRMCVKSFASLRYFLVDFFLAHFLKHIIALRPGICSEPVIFQISKNKTKSLTKPISPRA